MIDQNELEYRNLISFFKYLVTLVITSITLVVGIGLFFSYRDMNELKSELKAKIERMEAEISKLNNYAKETIDQTKDQTFRQLSILKDETKSIAINSTRERVNEAFKEGNIQYLVERTAETQLKGKLNKIVKEETDKFEYVFDNLPKLTTAYDQIRYGNRSYLDSLYYIQVNSENILLRSMAKTFLIQKGKDYEAQFYPEDEFGNKIVSQDSINNFLGNFALSELGFEKYPKNNKNNILSLIEIIQTDKDINRVMFGFKMLGKMLNMQIDVFDFEKIEKIKNRYK